MRSVNIIHLPPHEGSRRGEKWRRKKRDGARVKVRGWAQGEGRNRQIEQ